MIEADRLHERVAGDLDPQVHRVKRGKPRARALRANGPLQIGLDIRQEQDLAFPGGERELGLEMLEHAQARLERLPAVEVPAVLPGPEERLPARDVLDVADIDAAAAQHVELGVAEVIADGPDDAHLVEEGRGQREVHGGPAEHALALAKRRLDRIEGD